MGVILALMLLLPQAPGGAAPVPTPATPTTPTTQKLGVDFDANGWPVAPSSGTASAPVRANAAIPSPKDASAATPKNPVPSIPPAPLGEVAPDARVQPSPMRTDGARGAGRSLVRAIAGAGDAAAFRSWGIVKIRWRVLVLGEREAVLGDREVVQWTDAMRCERERLQFPDGRTFLRRSGKVEAERHGMPWPTLEPQAMRELEFFAAQAGFPWRLLDADRYVEDSSEIAQSSDPDFWRVRLVKRPASDVLGPSPVPLPARDAVEIVVASASGLPTEWVVESGSEQARRTIRLTDWRDVHGLKIPFQRTFLDAAGQPASRLQIEAIEVGIRPEDVDLLPN